MTARMESRKAWEAAELEPLTAAIAEARSRGLRDDARTLQSGLDLRARLEEVIALQDAIVSMLDNDPKLRELKSMLRLAEKLEMNSEVRAVSAVLWTHGG